MNDMVKFKVRERATMNDNWWVPNVFVFIFMWMPFMLIYAWKKGVLKYIASKYWMILLVMFLWIWWRKSRGTRAHALYKDRQLKWIQTCIHHEAIRKQLSISDFLQIYQISQWWKFRENGAFNKIKLKESKKSSQNFRTILLLLLFSRQK